MKKYFCLILILGFFILLLCFPHAAFLGASNGLLLWFHTILPTLLPFIILSNLLIHTNAVYYISRVLSPFIRHLFGVSEQASYAVLVGFLCGYPMGAKVTADLVKSKYINPKEGQYLLSFCNNTSLMFIISFIVMQNFQDETLLFGTILILLSSPIFCSFLFRIHYNLSRQKYSSQDNIDKNFYFNFAIFDNSIMNGFETITKIGGYIILFSILFSLGSNLPANWILPLLEISNGVPWLMSANLPFKIMYSLVLGLTSFGGFCAIAQTYSMIQDTKLSIKPYIIQKLITATVTSLLAYIYIVLIHQ